MTTLRVVASRADSRRLRATTGGAAPAAPASEPAAAPTPGTTLVQITEEKNERRRLSVFSASARRKRAAGHLRQVEKKRHAHDPHPGVTGQLEYDHPVSYEVAVAKKPRMILNSEVMGDEQPVPP